MNIGPEKYSDAELEAMPSSQLEKLHESCRSWMDALKICPEFWEYSALSGRIEAIWNRRCLHDETQNPPFVDGDEKRIIQHGRRMR